MKRYNQRMNITSLRPFSAALRSRRVRSFRLGILSFGLGVLSFGLPAGAFAEDPKGAEQISIGAIASLTGQAGEQGKNWLNGVRLAEDELHAKGVPVVLRVEDDNTNPAKAVSAFRKMADFDHVRTVIGGTWDFLAEALVPLATSAKIPFIMVTDPIEILSKEALASQYVFTNALSLKNTEPAMRRFIEEKKPHAAAILAPNFPFTVAHADLAERLLKEKGIPVVFRSTFSYDDYFQTVKVLASRVVKSKADLVFIFTSAQALDPFVVTLAQQNAHPMVFNTQHLDAAFAATSNRAAYANCYAAYPRVTDPDFAKRYQAKFHEDPRVYSAEGYDAMMFAALALHSGASLADEKANFEYHGVTGLYRLPATSRQIGSVGATIMTTRNGVFEPAKELSEP